MDIFSFFLFLDLFNYLLFIYLFIYLFLCCSSRDTKNIDKVSSLSLIERVICCCKFPYHQEQSNNLEVGTKLDCLADCMYLWPLSAQHKDRTSVHSAKRKYPFGSVDLARCIYLTLFGHFTHFILN